MSARVADVLHKSIVTLCLGVTVVGLADVAFMHKSIMAKGSEAMAKQEMDQLRDMRETDLAASTTEPFPQGTDLHDGAQQARV